jgi:carboxypeptidase T
MTKGLFILACCVGFFASNSAHALTPYEKVKTYIKQIADANPQTTKIIRVGDSDSGDTIWGLQIGNGPAHHLVVATHHGNEYGSTDVTAAFANDMAKNPVAGATVFVIPTLNIVGFNNNNRNEPNSSGTSLDPNRDYPGPCTTSGPFFLKSTNSLAHFIEDNNIIVAATLHTYTPAVAYPWGMDTPDTGTPYDDFFIKLGRAATVESGYPVGNSTQLIYGADGTFEDYAFWKLGIWTLLFELGDTHTPSQSAVQNMIATNVPGLRRMVTVAPSVRAPNHAFTGRCSTRHHDMHKE